MNPLKHTATTVHEFNARGEDRTGTEIKLGEMGTSFIPMQINNS